MAEFVTGVSTQKLPTGTIAVRPKRVSRSICMVAFLWVLLAPPWSSASALEQPANDDSAATATAADTALPDAPPTPHQDQSKSFASSLGTAVKTIGEDELHIIKAPFSLSSATMKWNALV